jgi:hypothetical protein
MKHVLLSFFLTTAALSATTMVDFIRAWSLEGDIPLETGIPPSREMVVLPSDQHEVHAVVVDMPQRASLAHASPETWGTLPRSDPPYEQPPATPMLQLAMNPEIEGSN